MKIKSYLLVIVFQLLIINLFAQAPKSFNYQGVARDADGQVLSQQTIGLKVSILSQDNPNVAQYTEIHQVKTNNFGLFALKIGQGEALSGSMDDIDWGASAHYLSTEMDVNNNGHFVMMGTASLLSVPYALYAEKSGSAMNGEARAIDFGGTFGQTIRHNGNDWEASSNIYNTSNNVGIGTTSPGEKLQVNGNIKIGATNQITIGNNRGLAVDNNRNIMQGNQTGFSLTTGSNNNLIGHQSGKANTSGSNNSFIGYQAGLENTTGSANSFYGYKAGGLNTTGSNNFYSGLQAGYGSTTGINNIAIGTKAGFAIGAGNDNTFVGREAGLNTNNNRNTFIGKSAGDANVSGTENTYIGYNADGADTLVNATAIGANSVVTTSNSVVLGNAANVGINTSAPQSKLHVEDGMLVTGTFGSGDDISVAGAGSRMLFNPKKAAFRTGYIANDSWDNANVGEYSVALGRSNIASGESSFAVGYDAEATNTNAIALGYSATATGQNAIAMGFETDATGENSFTSGYDTKANGSLSTAIGYGNTANGLASFAVGEYTEAAGNVSASFGLATTAKSYGEMAIGMLNTDYNPDSISGWAATDRLFVVGNGTDYGSRSDAFMILKNANTGIGTSTPQDKLHVNGSIRMVDGNQAAGYIPVSDANGKMTWTDPATVSASPFKVESNLVSANPLLVDNTTDDFVFGSPQLADDGDTLHFNRFFFDKSKGAFRAGTARGDQWDDTKVGNSSFAAGYDVTASGDYSVALGERTWATDEAAIALGTQAYANGYRSYALGNDVQANDTGAIAIGNTSKAEGEFSVVIGVNSDATANHSVAIGFDALASDSGAVAFGKGATATGPFSLAGGFSSAASGEYAVAFGHENFAIGDASVALGASSLASGEGSFALGRDAYATSDEAIAMGHGVQSTAPGAITFGHELQAISAYETVLGINNTNYTPVDTNGWEGEDRLLTVGNGGGGEPSDAMVILKNGNTGIGNSAPEEMLHITHGLTPKILLHQDDSYGWTDYKWSMGGNESYYSVRNETANRVPFRVESRAPTFALSIENNGNVGMGTNNPIAKLDVRGAISMADGNQAAGYIPVSDANGIMTWTDPSSFVVGVNSWTVNGNDQYSAVSGNVGLGSSAPTEKLDVNGSIKMVDGNQQAGYIPVSDANGKMTWTDPTTITTANDSDWVVSGNHLYSGLSGNVGIGTTAPEDKLHLVHGDSPSIMFHQNASLGYPIQKWSIGGNEAAFFVRDEDVNRLPLRIEAGAPDYSIDIESDGDVGIGTNSPSAKLDVRGAIRMVDGNQQAGYIPVSDSTGKMTWTSPLTQDLIKNGHEYSTTESSFIGSSSGWRDAYTAVPLVQGSGNWLVFATFRAKISSGTGTDELSFRIRANAGSCSPIYSEGTGVLENFDNHRDEYQLVSFHRVINLTGSCNYTFNLQVNCDNADDTIFTDDVTITAIKID